jgi:hypothetical protein
MLCSERSVEGSLKDSSGATFKERACNVTAEYEMRKVYKCSRFANRLRLFDTFQNCNINKYRTKYAGCISLEPVTRNVRRKESTLNRPTRFESLIFRALQIELQTVAY